MLSMAVSPEELATAHKSTAARLRRIVHEKRCINGTTAELASQFGYPALTREVGEYIETILANAGLRVRPPLAKCEAETKIRVSRSRWGLHWPILIVLTAVLAAYWVVFSNDPATRADEPSEEAVELLFGLIALWLAALGYAIARYAIARWRTGRWP